MTFDEIDKIAFDLNCEEAMGEDDHETLTIHQWEISKDKVRWFAERHGISMELSVSILADIDAIRDCYTRGDLDCYIQWINAVPEEPKDAEAKKLVREMLVLSCEVQMYHAWNPKPIDKIYETQMKLAEISQMISRLGLSGEQVQEIANQIYLEDQEEEENYNDNEC